MFMKLEIEANISI